MQPASISSVVAPNGQPLADERRPRVVWSCVMLMAVISSLLIFRNRNAQAPVWTVPYLSGAANYSWQEGWRVEKASLAHYKRLSPEERWRYRAPPVAESELMPYKVLPVGFLFVQIVARNLLPGMGDLQALLVLQCIVHLLSCWLILTHLRSNMQRVLFLLGYAANPVVIHFVTFPFYYFWQTLVPVCVVHCLLRDWKVPVGQAVLMVLVACASVWIRPATLFVAAGLVVMLAWRLRRALGCTLIVVFIAGIAGQFGKGAASPAHTMFAGLGAYDNPEGLYLSDESATKYFERKTGEKPVFSVASGFGGNWYEPEFQKRYYSVMEDGVRDFVQQHPVLMLRNVIVNSLQGFSVGYITNVPDAVRYVVAGTGLVFIVLLIRTKQWVLLAANTLAIGSFTPYFPPIPAYMFGSYVLLGTCLVLFAGPWMKRLVAPEAKLQQTSVGG